ncbi:hypothetical protein FA13DRAFT_1808141 [Coprinellus micaceus]|uniref:Uncharacterized protein n=1 Tax=Coprinellus micaceus TaxID=71717 RepID=A0A4Y7U1Q3_COPMI|nr:hypothetical protein FA13DRAFT_1808141 [Coprinellus micaceus]
MILGLCASVSRPILTNVSLRNSLVAYIPRLTSVETVGYVNPWPVLGSPTTARPSRTFHSVYMKPSKMERTSPSASVGILADHRFAKDPNLGPTASSPEVPRPDLPWDESEFGTAKSRLNDADFVKKYLGFTPNAATGAWSIFRREKLEDFLMKYRNYKRELLL